MEWLTKYLPIDETGNLDFSAYVERTAQGEHSVWIPILIVTGVLGLWFICKFIRRLHANDWHNQNCLLEGYMMTGNSILLVVTNLLIIAYVLTSGPSAVWFLLPGDDANWLRVVICGVIYLYALVNLLVALLKTMDDYCETEEGNINLKWGIITLVVGIAANTICALSAPQYLVFVFIAMLACQLIQMGFIYQKAVSKGVSVALAACGIYFVGTIGLIMMAIPFILLVIILTIVALTFVFILKSSMEDDKKRDVIVYNDGRIVDKYNGTEYERNADGTIKPKYP